MAKFDDNKFKFYESYYLAALGLKDEHERQGLLWNICRYVFDGAEPTFDSEEGAAAFAGIQPKIDRSLSAALKDRRPGYRDKSAYARAGRRPETTHAQG